MLRRWSAQYDQLEGVAGRVVDAGFHILEEAFAKSLRQLSALHGHHSQVLDVAQHAHALLLLAATPPGLVGPTLEAISHVCSTFNQLLTIENIGVIY